MKYTLHVSRDYGSNYRAEAHSDSIADFKAQCQQLDRDWLRYYVTDENDLLVLSCWIHEEILKSVKRERGGSDG